MASRGILQLSNQQIYTKSIVHFYFHNSIYRSDEPIGAIAIYFLDEIKVSEEFILYNTYTLIANIGGLVGMTLGISMIRLRDIVKRCLDRT